MPEPTINQQILNNNMIIGIVLANSNNDGMKKNQLDLALNNVKPKDRYFVLD